MIGLWGNYFEFGAKGWQHPRRAFIAGVPDSVEHAGLVHLAVFSDPGKDQSLPPQWQRKGVSIAKDPPAPNTPAEPTQEGRLGLFVLDPLLAGSQAGTIPPSQRRRAVKS